MKTKKETLNEHFKVITSVGSGAKHTQYKKKDTEILTSLFSRPVLEPLFLHQIKTRGLFRVCYNYGLLY